MISLLAVFIGILYVFVMSSILCFLLATTTAATTTENNAVVEKVSVVAVVGITSLLLTIF